MDDLIGFIFISAIVLAIAYFIIVFATTALLSLYVLLEQVMRGWWFLPAHLSWGLTATVFISLMHFACAESHAFRRPALRPVLITLAFAWLGISWLVGLGAVDASQQLGQSKPRPPDAPGALIHNRPIGSPENRQSPRPDPPVMDHTRDLSQDSSRDAARPYETAYVKTSALNVRRGPGEQYQVLEVISKGALVRIYERETAADGRVWVRVHPGSSEGWVSEQMLKLDAASQERRRDAPSDPSSRSVPASSNPDPRSRALVDTDQVNVRAGPGIAYQVVGKLDRGVGVQVIERRLVADGGTWVRIEANGLSGWVNGRLLRTLH